MLVHTKETTDTMYGLTETIGPFAKEVRNAIDESARVLMEDGETLLKEFEKHYNNQHAKFNTPNFTWQQLIDALRDYFDDISTALFPEVKEISSAE